MIVIKHWRMHNCISQNRYHETQYTDEKSQLLLKKINRIPKLMAYRWMIEELLRHRVPLYRLSRMGNAARKELRGNEEIITLRTLRSSGRSTQKQLIKGRDIKNIRHVSMMDFPQKSY